jgi:hypothetical protein
MGANLKCHLFIKQLQTWLILKEPIVVVEGLKIKPYLFRNASWDYLLCNFNPIDGNLDKIMFDQQMNVSKVNIWKCFWDS